MKTITNLAKPEALTPAQRIRQDAITDRCAIQCIKQTAPTAWRGGDPSYIISEALAELKEDLYDAVWWLELRGLAKRSIKDPGVITLVA